MRLDQFDKLQDLAKELLEKTLCLKQENYRLKAEIKNSTLIQHSNPVNQDNDSGYKALYSKLLEEHKKLKTKNIVAQEHLSLLINSVEDKLQNKTVLDR